MEKLLKFWIIFAAFVLFPKESFSYELVPTGHLILDECNAPAPLDFRMTARGADFIDAAWEPAWANATHTVTVSVANTGGGTNAWDHLYTLNSVPGSSVRLNDLPTGEHYQIKIFTNCSNGMPGVVFSSFSDKTILDLVIAGRTPINPVVVPCTNIRYDLFSNEWIGFRVTYRIGDQNLFSSLFELKIIASKDLNDLHSSTVQIARVSYDNPIKAVNLGGDYPTVIEPIIEALNPFRLKDFAAEANNQIIGSVYVNRYLETRLVDLCVENAFPLWNYNNYHFEVLIAEGGIEPPGFNEGGNNLLGLKKNEAKMFIVENPISDFIHLKGNSKADPIQNVNYQLMNSKGDIIQKSQLELTSSSLVAIPVHGLSKGVYFLMLSNGLIYENFKLIKI